MRAFPGLLTPLAIYLPLLSSHLPSDTKEPLSPVVLVQVGMGHGSGVHIGGGYVLTNRHVVENSEDAMLKTESGAISKAVVLWVHPAEDLALVHTNHFGNIGVAELACRRPAKGEAIRAVGNPFSHEFITTTGRISGPPVVQGTETLSPADITIAPGMSGGPVFDSDNRVIGLSTAFYKQAPGMALIVPAEVACRLLAREAM